VIVLPPADFALLVELQPKRPKPPKGQPEHVPSADGFYSVHTIALRWGCGSKTVSRRLERYRGRKGFQERGHKDGNTKTHTRKYSIIGVTLELLLIIEADMRR